MSVGESVMKALKGLFGRPKLPCSIDIDLDHERLEFLLAQKRASAATRRAAQVQVTAEIRQALRESAPRRVNGHGGD